MKWLIICLAATCALGLNLQDKHPCDNHFCRAGRECVLSDGEPQCLCVVSCANHVKPVCGSDGRSYNNHCLLHQRACIEDEHIRISHKGYCKRSYDKKWKEDKAKGLISKHDLQDELQNDLIRLLQKNKKKSVTPEKAPAVCFSPQRNALRFLLVEHFQEALTSQTWYNAGETYREGLWGWFYTCDTTDDYFLTSDELKKCAEDVAFFARPGQDNEVTKALCIDALIDDADRNDDWRLDFEEFTRVMDPKYQPKDKKCSLEGKKYLDGDEIHVDCSFCVCGAGKWVCGDDNCEKDSNHLKSKKKSHHHSSDIDNALDALEQMDKNDVIGQDTWLEQLKHDKRRAKETKQAEESKKEVKKEIKKEDFDVNDNLFLDYEDDEEDEDTDLNLDEYYDELEKSKVKNPKKKKYQLEKALKEVKTLIQETEHMKHLLAEKSTRKESTKPVLSKRNTKDIRKSKKIHRKKLVEKSKKYYDKIYEDTDWHSLLDWGSTKNKKYYKSKGNLNDV